MRRRDEVSDVAFVEWAKKMKDNFERCFWVPVKSQEDTQYEISPQLVKRRGIYKDVYKSHDASLDL